MSNLAPVSLRTPAAGRYRIDPDRSTVSFTTRHLFGLAGVAGTFGLKEAEVIVTDPPTATTLSAVIDADSFETGSAGRDRDVKSAKYLDTANYPDITVTGAGLVQREGRWTATGSILAHGVAAPLELSIENVEEHDNELTVRGSARVDRYAHGVTAGKGMAGRWLNITIEATAVL